MKIGNSINSGKDIITKEKQQNIVYKLSCKDCEATYVGQTKRPLLTRIKEHKHNINISNLSVISEHIINNNHTFNWEDTKILDRETGYNKRIISEMLHIKTTDNTVNYINDTKNLPNNYEPLLQ